MQPTEGFSVARRALDVEDYIDILRRHKGWIFGPFLFTLVASVVGVHLWPDSYRSRAMVQIKPQQVPQNMVQSAVNQSMTDRINTMTNQILSRNVLTTVIRNYGLYESEQSRQPFEDVISLMRKNINIVPVQAPVQGTQRTVAAFTVEFSYRNRYDAQRVVQDLVTRFIDENIRQRTNSTFQTRDFLEDQTSDAKQKLDEISTRLTQFRLENNGRLPDQLDANMRNLTSLQTNYSYLVNSIAAANQQKMQLETDVRIYRDRIRELQQDAKVAPPQAPKSQRLLEVEREIEAYDRQLTDLRRQYKENYPDVQIVKNRLEDARQRKADIVAEEAAAAAQAPAGPTIDPRIQAQIREVEDQAERLESQIQVRNVEIQGYQDQVKEIEQQITLARGRIQAVPVGEREYDDLIREQKLANEEYIAMNTKLEAAQVAEEMEGREQGEQLEVLDAASLPINPTEPKRGMVVSIGAGVGLLLGIVIAGAREVKDTSLKNLKDVRAYTQMAILGSVPLLENDFVVRRRRRIAWLGWTTACLLAAVTMAGSVVYYYATKT